MSARACESRKHVEESKESFTSRLWKTVASGSRTFLCEERDGAGQSAEFCSHGSAQASEIDVFAVKIVRGDMNSGSKSTVAVSNISYA